MTPHAPKKLRGQPWTWCTRCGLVYLRNALTAWCVQHGCDHDTRQRKDGGAMKPRRRALWLLVANAIEWAGFFGSKAFLFAIEKAAGCDEWGVPLESSRWDEDERDAW